MGRTIVVANGQDQARSWRTARELPYGDVTVLNTCSAYTLPQGLHPLASEVVLLEGWELGRHSHEVRSYVERALAKRNQLWSDCRHETTTSPAPLVFSITGCARCGCDGHDDVMWQPLAYPFDPCSTEPEGAFTHWAPCPNNGEPIMMRVTEMSGEIGRHCPNGHVVRPATSPSCMVGSGYYWCGRCESVPTFRAVSGGPAMGMYYGETHVTEGVTPNG